MGISAKGKKEAPRNGRVVPRIVSHPHIAGGAPVIKGTRVTVRTIAGYYQMGMSVDEILLTLRHLTPAQVHYALAYYFDHKRAIDAEIKANDDIAFWKRKALKPATMKKRVA